jgi:aminoglycoside 6'-N-acetyltransferase
MTEADLPAVQAWLRLPHVARWWTPDTTAEAEIAKYRERVRQHAEPATHMLMVTLDSMPIGWCQWYRWADYPDDAQAIGARDGEIGIDYAIGDPTQVGRGVGTTLIATLTTEIRRRHPGAGILTDPDAANMASRRVLEKNGFHLVAVQPVATETSDAPMAIYRLSSAAPCRNSRSWVVLPGFTTLLGVRRRLSRGGRSGVVGIYKRGTETPGLPWGLTAYERPGQAGR